LSGLGRWPTLGLPVSLRDEFAHAEQVNALQLVREGVIDPMDLRSRKPPLISSAQRLWSSESWVRQALAVQELMEPLSWSSLPWETHKLQTQLLETQQPEVDTAQEVGLGFRGQAPFIRLQRPSLQLFESELPQVLAYADLRAERSSEILSQIDGQWAHWCSILPMRPDCTPHTLALLTTALQWVIPVELRFKHALGCPRPIAWSPQVQPCITTPGHGTFPMGHAVQAFLTAGILQALCGAQPDDAWGVQLTRTAFRMAINRVVAGVHFPVDLVAGLVLGLSLSRYLCHMADPKARGEPWPMVVFDPVRYQSLGPLGGLHSGEDVMRAFQVSHSTAFSANAVSPEALQAPAWVEMWRAAAQEWQEVNHGA
jgi:hypothetical protein